MPDQSNVENTAHDKVKSLTDDFAGQMTTLENKYHHKEIAFDKYIEMGEFYCKSHTDALEALITSETRKARLDELSILIDDDRNPALNRQYLKERHATLTQEKDK